VRNAVTWGGEVRRLLLRANQGLSAPPSRQSRLTGSSAPIEPAAASCVPGDLLLPGLLCSWRPLSSSLRCFNGGKTGVWRERLPFSCVEDTATPEVMRAATSSLDHEERPPGVSRSAPPTSRPCRGKHPRPLAAVAAAACLQPAPAFRCPVSSCVARRSTTALVASPTVSSSMHLLLVCLVLCESWRRLLGEWPSPCKV
jgi:hypothetical protein